MINIQVRRNFTTTATGYLCHCPLTKSTDMRNIQERRNSNNYNRLPLPLSADEKHGFEKYPSEEE
jgi:hypothetical protein